MENDTGRNSRPGPDHYRYEIDGHDEYAVIRTRTFFVLAETPCGYWVIENGSYGYPDEYTKRYRKWVMKGTGRRFCYPTREAALKSFRIRKRRQVEHCERSISQARMALAAVDRMQDEMLSDTPVKVEHFNFGPGVFPCATPAPIAENHYAD